MNLGFLEGVLELGAYTVEDGKFPLIPYRESGNWEDALPKYELQADKYETWGCTTWGAQNQIETQQTALWGGHPNYSERFTYNLTPVLPRYGADPQKVYECIRKHGLINDAEFPMPDTLEEFIDKEAITGTLLARGQRWLNIFELRHAWLWNKRPEQYMEVLKYVLKSCPIGVSVDAWNEKNGVYISTGDSNNHWCLLYKFDDEGYPWVFDTYNFTKKRLAKDHNIRRAKAIWLNNKTRRGGMKHLTLLQRILNSILMKPTIVNLANLALGKDITPHDEVADEVSCAWSLSKLEKDLDPTFMQVAGTWTLWDQYMTRKDFKRVETPQVGTRIICATVPGHPFPGHCGVFMEDMTIASNDSFTGKFMKNHTLETWKRYYGEKGGYEIFFFDKV